MLSRRVPMLEGIRQAQAVLSQIWCAGRSMTQAARQWYRQLKPNAPVVHHMELTRMLVTVLARQLDAP